LPSRFCLSVPKPVANRPYPPVKTRIFKHAFDLAHLLAPLLLERVNAVDDLLMEETLSYQLPDALEKFAQSFLLERTKAGGEPPVHPLFSAVESLLASSLTLTDLVPGN
jgi:hypothetical protein